MADGVRLAISLWLPDTDQPVPVVLETTPYRKRDSSRATMRARSEGRNTRSVALAAPAARRSASCHFAACSSADA